jgi:hypothetical protein
MAFTSESARFMLRSRGGKAYARNNRARGFPTLVKARAALAAKHARLRAEQLALESSVNAARFASRYDNSPATHR